MREKGGLFVRNAEVGDYDVQTLLIPGDLLQFATSLQFRRGK